MTRDECIELLEKNVKQKNLRKHMLATEAVMAALARKLGEDPAKWARAGLVHDLDYDQTCDAPERHGLVSADMLVDLGFPEDVVHAVKAHNDHVPRESQLDRALYASDPVTGFIVAAALMHPAKTLDGVDLDFLMKRFKEKRFAAGASREQMRSCQDLGMSLEEFLETALEAMQGIGSELGL